MKVMVNFRRMDKLRMADFPHTRPRRRRLRKYGFPNTLSFPGGERQNARDTFTAGETGATMKAEIQEAGGKLYATLTGELDHHAAKDVTGRLFTALDTHLPTSCELNLQGLSFMDSSGIAVILGLFKRMQEIDGTLIVKNTPKAPMKVLRAAGLDGIVRFE